LVAKWLKYLKDDYCHLLDFQTIRLRDSAPTIRMPEITFLEQLCAVKLSIAIEDA
jgi:hypothetical protein